MLARTRPHSSGITRASGLRSDTARLVGSTFGERACQTFRNRDAVLRAGGGRPELVVNTTVLVADANDGGELSELYGEFFAIVPLARMTMQVLLARGLLLQSGASRS